MNKSEVKIQTQSKAWHKSAHKTCVAHFDNGKIVGTNAERKEENWSMGPRCVQRLTAWQWCNIGVTKGKLGHAPADAVNIYFVAKQAKTFNVLLLFFCIRAK